MKEVQKTNVFIGLLGVVPSILGPETSLKEFGTNKPFTWRS
jgi:hypothetical protein